MTEQLISFETAKLAKEKGFNIPSYVYQQDGRYIPTITNIGRDIIEDARDKYTYAPTQSLLQRWVWETHSIWVQSTPIFTANECIGVSVTISSWRFPVINVNYVGFDVYDGLENGLFEALKLI